MTDRELLERAARAAGIKLMIETIPHRTAMHGTETVYRTDGHACKNWNPLTDDGDALRLAVKLSMDLSLNTNHCIACADTGHIENNVENGDGCAAARRAIVRAAASMEPDESK